MKTLHMTTLGCDKNTIDSEMMLGLIEEKNYDIIDDPQAAEIIIVNTCCFIQSAKEQSIDYILEYVEYKNSGSCQLLIVAGCMAERYHQELAAEIPEVDGFLGVGHFDNILDLITALETRSDSNQPDQNQIDNEEKRHPVCAGDLTICVCGEKHGLENTGAEPLTFVAVIAKK